MAQKPKAATEFVTDLQEDRDFLARRQKHQTDQLQPGQDRGQALSPVVGELQQAGFAIQSLDELRESGIQYKSAIPILLKWLPLIEDPDGKESIVRTLSVPWAKQIAVLPLISEFKKAPDRWTGLKWAIGNALEVVSDSSAFRELYELVKDRHHGTARQMIVLAFRKMKDPNVVDALIELLNDDEISGHALKALSKFRSEKTRPHFERFMNDERSWVRKEAAKALAKLG